MASYFLRARHITRAKGSRVTRAAAYRAGERILDERTSEVYNHSKRDDVADKEVVLPSELAGREDMRWARDRSKLWNAAEHSGRRRNSRVARELLVLLPPELTSAQRSGLVRRFSQELADKFGGAVDYTIHAPRPDADRRNHHAHMLMTTREVTPEGLGARTTLELGGREAHLLGAPSSRAEYLLVRERWAQVTNEALREAGIAARVDHRSFKDQGIDREPTPTIPEKVFYTERRLQTGTAAGDAIRARHRERVAAREKGGNELARVERKQREGLRQQAIADLSRRDSLPKKVRWGALTREERNQLRREQWRAGREARARDPEREAKRKEAARLSARAAWQRRGPELRERRRQWRLENADKVNRNQQAYRKANAVELNRKRRENRRAQAEREAAVGQPRPAPTAEESTRNWMARQQATSLGPTTEQSTKSWLARSQTHEPGPTAEESVRNWLERRQTHQAGPTAEESARNWLAFRESRQGADSARAADEQLSRETEQAGSRAGNDNDDDDEANRKRDRSRDHDFGL
jgi:hypothetical protein